LRSRPPRVLEGPGLIDHRAPKLRRVNIAILNRASVQANTLPSGHVAGAVAAALAIWPVDATAAAVLAVLAVLIATAAALCRYHYVIDCVTGGAVALLAAGVVNLVT
ncbi:MAG: phosphatase PAP2 family protein, partial [Bryobacteraceae bacterium]